MDRSFVYSNILIYRAVMNVLYSGGYQARFRRVLDALGTEVRSVCELCFADTAIASACRDREIRWIGVDLNPHFCARARRLGFEVLEGDLRTQELALPDADVYIIVGSLYHFHDDLAGLLGRVFARAQRLIVLEPIQNVSSSRGILGKVARLAANPGSGPASFRFDQDSLLAALEEHQRGGRYRFDVEPAGRDLFVDLRSDLSPSSRGRSDS